MRKAIDGLAAIVEGVLDENPSSGRLYLFCGKRRDRLKALVWEKDGYVLLYKRLNNGVFHVAKSNCGCLPPFFLPA